MKTYRNRLYSIPDAAKRAGIAEHKLRTLISVDLIKCDKQYGSPFIWGKEIPEIKNKWEWFNRKGVNE